MLSKVFKPFQRRQKEIVPEGEQETAHLSPEDIAFIVVAFKAIIQVEKDLHYAEDPIEIATTVMQAVCKVYDAEYCGILSVDEETAIWQPEIWFDVNKGAMKDTLIHKYELNEDYSNWVYSLKEQQPIIVRDAETIRSSNPTEYARYRRLEVKSVMGVPFGQHPLGFMVVKNLNRYFDHPELLQIACFVAMMMLRQKRRQETRQRIQAAEGAGDDRQLIRLNLLGPHSLEINGDRIDETNLAHPNRRAWTVLAYLALHTRPQDQNKMFQELWPDEDPENAGVNTRKAISRLHNDLAFYDDIKVIDMRNGRLKFTDDVHIVTDAGEMETLFEEAKKTGDQEAKIEFLKEAYSLYRGRAFESGDAGSNVWLYLPATHYSQVYIDITNALLELLYREGEYHEALHYGSSSLGFEAGNAAAYYWTILAAEKTGNETTIRSLCRAGREHLQDEEYNEVRDELIKKGFKCSQYLK